MYFLMPLIDIPFPSRILRPAEQMNVHVIRVGINFDFASFMMSGGNIQTDRSVGFDKLQLTYRYAKEIFETPNCNCRN
jgi:hypothetical protein